MPIVRPDRTPGIGPGYRIWVRPLSGWSNGPRKLGRRGRMAGARGRPGLIITADDYGYARGYDEGIVEAAGAGALDAVSAMVLREGIEPKPLLGTGTEIGLHLELPPEATERDRAGRRAVEDGGELPPGLTEWMVHPGHRHPESGSGYDQAREEDLDLLLGLGLDPALSAARLTHAAAFG